MEKKTSQDSPKPSGIRVDDFLDLDEKEQLALVDKLLESISQQKKK